MDRRSMLVHVGVMVTVLVALPWLAPADWLTDAPPEPSIPPVEPQLGVVPLEPEPNIAWSGSTFEGPNFDTNITNTSGSAFIPPDPIGAAGPSHLVCVVNVSIEWHLKDGTQQNSESLEDFFTSLGPVDVKLFDPKVIYDQHSGRFVVVTLERSDTAVTSRILLAVSATSDPNGTWHFHAIDSKINISGTDYWADYPGFAVDEEAVYITNNLFTFGTGQFGGQRLWIVEKSAFYAGNTAVWSIYDPWTAVGQPNLSSTTQPAHIFGAAPTGVGTWLVRYSGLNDSTNVALGIIRVDSPTNSPTFDLQFVNFGTVAATDGLASMPDAPQLGSAETIETNDRRALHAVWRDNGLWMTTTIVPPTGADSNQVTAHWVKIDTTNITALTIADQGNVGGEDIATGTHTFFPSIAVGSGNSLGIGFAASAATIYAGAYYTGRLASEPAGTVQSVGTLAAGTDYYYRAFGGSRNRWGDYSGICVDPSDERVFWVFNQYAMTRGTVISSEDGRWATRWGRFSPDSALPVELATFDASVSEDGIHLEWVTVSEAHNLGFNVLRRSENDPVFRQVGFVASEGDQSASVIYDYRDDQVVPGETYTYRLEDIDTSGIRGKGVEIRVPFVPETSAVMSSIPEVSRLLPCYPNPFNPEVWIPYELAQGAEVVLRIYAPQGQLVRSLGLGSKSAGRYINRGDAIHWDGTNSFGQYAASGVYFYHLEAGDLTATRRMILLK